MLEQALVDASFTRVDFVYEPGQYSVRGGIVDVFSYSESKPYRLDFFGDEVDSIRRFNISSQLSQDKLQQAEIIPNLNAREGGRVSLVEAAGDVCYWFSMRITPCGAWTICGGGCSPRRTIPPAWTVR